MVRTKARESLKVWGAQVATRLRLIRGGRDQRDFAPATRVVQQTVSKYERGDIPRSWDFLSRLHDEHNVDLNALLSRRREPDHSDLFMPPRDNGR